MTYLSTIARLPGRWLHMAPRGLIRFLCVGFGGLAVDQSVLWTSEHLGAPYWAARAIAIFLATCVTWALNRRFTFGHSGRAPHHEALRYFAVAMVAQYGVNYPVSLIAPALAPHMSHQLAAFCGAVVATVFSYSGQRFFTFARAPEQLEKAVSDRD